MEGTNSENHLTSAAAFVEGGIQEACDDACSICLEAFSESDPSTVTGCKHEFHLQCILEWCQRSSQCPMCWQSISLKDPNSQELLDGIEQEKRITNNLSRNSAIFHHPAFGNFDLHSLPGNATDAELEERIIQQLVAMGRARHIARRENRRNRSSIQNRPLLSPPSTSQPSISSGDSEPTSASPSVSTVLPASPHGSPSTTRNLITQLSPSSEDRTAGPSETHTFSESFKTRINAWSMRYKESIVKNTRDWKERLFSRTNAGVERDAGLATLSGMSNQMSVSNSLEESRPPSDQMDVNTHASEINER